MVKVDRRCSTNSLYLTSIRVNGLAGCPRTGALSTQHTPTNSHSTHAGHTLSPLTLGSEGINTARSARASNAPPATRATRRHPHPHGARIVPRPRRPTPSVTFASQTRRRRARTSDDRRRREEALTLVRSTISLSRHYYHHTTPAIAADITPPRSAAHTASQANPTSDTIGSTHALTVAVRIELGP